MLLRIRFRIELIMTEVRKDLLRNFLQNSYTEDNI